MITGLSARRVEEAWANDNILEYAAHKTTAIFAPARSVMRESRIRMEEVIVKPQFSMGYLGVIVDRDAAGRTRSIRQGKGRGSGSSI